MTHKIASLQPHVEHNQQKGDFFQFHEWRMECSMFIWKYPFISDPFSPCFFFLLLHSINLSSIKMKRKDHHLNQAFLLLKLSKILSELSREFFLMMRMMNSKKNKIIETGIVKVEREKSWENDAGVKCSKEEINFMPITSSSLDPTFPQISKEEIYRFLIYWWYFNEIKPFFFLLLWEKFIFFGLTI